MLVLVLASGMSGIRADKAKRNLQPVMSIGLKARGYAELCSVDMKFVLKILRLISVQF